MIYSRHPVVVKLNQKVLYFRYIMFVYHFHVNEIYRFKENNVTIYKGYYRHLLHKLYICEIIEKKNTVLRLNSSFL